MNDLVKRMLPAGVRQSLIRGRERLLTWSLKASARESGLDDLYRRLEKAVPDLREHYTNFDIDTEFLETKVRCQHAFQVSMALPELESRPGSVVVDIGDSSGSHITCFRALLPDMKHRFLSVNLDEKAVEKAKSKGIEAVCTRAENLIDMGIDADIFLSFEMLEHLSDPVSFLHGLASRTNCQRLVLTVPYVRQSRVGFHHIREGIHEETNAERVHIFELSPEDLRLVFRHAGWKIERDRVYLQYPRYSPLRATAPIWRSWDFEGFYGAVLSRDDSWSKMYGSWQ